MSAQACSGDAAAYALGALDAAEAEAFERHLADCEACVEELSRYGHVVDALAMSAPQHPLPSGLRRRVIRSVRSQPRSSHAPRRRRPGLIALGAGVAVGLAAVVLAILTLVPAGSSRARVLNARVLASTGSAQVRLANDRAQLIVHHLPAPAAGDIYEIWLQRPGHAPQPTRALFRVSTQGTSRINVPGTLHGAQTILVTEEPAGGTLVPTHPAVIVGRLS